MDLFSCKFSKFSFTFRLFSWTKRSKDRRATYGDDYAFLFLFPSTCLCWNLLLLNVGFLSFSPVYLFLAVVLLILWFVIRPPPPLPVLLKSIAMRLGRLPQKGDGAELSFEILMVALSMKEALKISASSAFIAEASLLREACLFSKALNIRKVLVESDDALAYFT